MLRPYLRLLINLPSNIISKLCSPFFFFFFYCILLFFWWLLFNLMSTSHLPFFYIWCSFPNFIIRQLKKGKIFNFFVFRFEYCQNECYFFKYILSLSFGVFRYGLPIFYFSSESRFTWHKYWFLPKLGRSLFPLFYLK